MDKKQALRTDMGSSGRICIIFLENDGHLVPEIVAQTRKRGFPDI